MNANKANQPEFVTGIYKATKVLWDRPLYLLATFVPDDNSKDRRVRLSKQANPGDHQNVLIFFARLKYLKHALTFSLLDISRKTPRFFHSRWSKFPRFATRGSDGPPNFQLRSLSLHLTRRCKGYQLCALSRIAASIFCEQNFSSRLLFPPMGGFLLSHPVTSSSISRTIRKRVLDSIFSFWNGSSREAPRY